LVTNPIVKDTTATRDYVCQIKAYQHIELRVLEKGYLQKIYVDEGQYIKEGQMMFQIMPMIYQAELQKAQAEANYAEIGYKNTKQLADQKYVYIVDKNNKVKPRRIELFIWKLTQNFRLEGLRLVNENDKIEYDYIKPLDAIEHLKLHVE